MKKLVGILLIIWVGLTVGSYYFAYSLIAPNDIQRFVDRGVRIRGKVISLNEEDHRLITYSYSVGNVTFEGSGNAGSGNPEFEEISIGDELIVFYDRQKPGDSILGFPQDDLVRAEQMVVVVAVLLPIFPIIVIGSLLLVSYHVAKSRVAPNR